MPESLANLSQGLDAEVLCSSCRMGTCSGEADGDKELRPGSECLGGHILLLLRAQPLIFNQENLVGDCLCPEGPMLLVTAQLLRATLDLGADVSSCAGACLGAWSRRLMREMNMRELFQDFQSHGLCGWWKQEAPSQDDMSCSLHCSSFAHQKQSVDRLCLCCLSWAGISTENHLQGQGLPAEPVPGTGHLGWGPVVMFAPGVVHLSGIHIILLACWLPAALLHFSGGLLGRLSSPKSIPRTDVGFSNIFTLTCLVVINY